jgi:hypothetical protein
MGYVDLRAARAGNSRTCPCRSAGPISTALGRLTTALLSQAQGIGPKSLTTRLNRSYGIPRAIVQSRNKKRPVRRGCLKQK